MSLLRLCWLSLPLFCCLQAAHAATPISGNVSGQTLAAGTWHVTGSLQVDAGTTLTLNPAAVLKFEPGTQLLCYGTVAAAGTYEHPAVLTSRDDDAWGETLMDSDGTPAPGDWDGVYLYGYSTNQGSAVLDWTVLRFGGGPGNPGAANLYGFYSDSILLGHCESVGSAGIGVNCFASSPVLSECRIADNGSHGVYATQSTPSLQDNVCETNAGWGALLDNCTLGSQAGNSGSGNGVNGLGLSGTVSAPSSWSHPDPGFPFILYGQVIVNDDVVLSLTAGTLVKANDQAQLYVYGSLVCTGTAGDPVRFVSLKDDSFGGDTNGDGPSSGSPGDWLGIQAYGYSSSEGLIDLDHTELHHGGGSGAGQGGLYLLYSDSATLDNCTLGHCSASGLQAHYCSPVITASRFEANGDHGVYITTDAAPQLTDNEFVDNEDWGAYLGPVTLMACSGNTGSGNGVNGMGLSGSVTASQAWSQPGPAFPFILDGQVTVNDDVVLSLPSGTLVKANDQAQLYVYGSLVCTGTAGDPVRFVSLKDDTFGGDTNGDGPSSGGPGDWLGIQAYGYSGSEGIVDLDHTELHHGGGSGAGQGGLYLLYCDSATLDNCTVGHCSASGLQAHYCSPVITASRFEANGDHGVYITTDAAPQLTDNEFVDNEDWGAYLGPVTFTAYSGNTGSGNGGQRHGALGLRDRFPGMVPARPGVPFHPRWPGHRER